jgi:ligand-binding sensor domain-containing protein
MKKLEIPFQRANLIIIFILLVGTSSCSGQENKADIQVVTKETKIISTDSNLEDDQSNNQSSPTSFQFSNFENQISDVVRTVFQDSKGNIWFGCQGGAFRHNGKSLMHIDSIKSELGRGVTIKDITEDKNGRIWFGHTDGISVLDGESITNYYESDGLLSNDVWCIATDKNNHVWIGTIEGVCKFDGRNFTAIEIPEGKLDTTRGVSSTKMIHNIMEDSKGRMWFSTNGGVYIKDTNSLTNISEKDGLSTSFVNEVIEDKNGFFWIATSNGLFRYADKSLKNITEDIIKNGKGIGTIMQDSDGNIWFNSNLRDIYSFNGTDFTKYRIAEGNYGPAAFKIYEDQQKRLWLVGYGGAFRYENNSFINITQNGPF